MEKHVRAAIVSCIWIFQALAITHQINMLEVSADAFPQIHRSTNEQITYIRKL